MVFNYKTQQYLKEMEAVKIDSKYNIFQINFHRMEAFVNQYDTYRKRNGKICHVEHHFGKWIPFTKDGVKYGKRNYKYYYQCIYGLEECEGQRTIKYLTKEIKEKIIADYESAVGRKINFIHPIKTEAINESRT